MADSSASQNKGEKKCTWNELCLGLHKAAHYFAPLTLPLGAIALVLAGEAAVIALWPYLEKLSLPASAWIVLVGIFSAALLVSAGGLWINRIDNHPGFIKETRDQTKDTIVIGITFLIVVLTSMVLTGCFSAECFTHVDPGDGQRWRFYLPMVWAFAGTALGGGAGFLFGLPKTRDSSGKAVNANMPLNYIYTGLDDIVDWLTKGVTTVALVKAETVIHRFPDWASELAKGLTLDGKYTAATQAFAEGILAFFPIVGFVGIYLVTRTYITGALTRADRSTLGAFLQAGLMYADVLVLQRNSRAVVGGGPPPAEAMRVARKLATLSLSDLHTPLEFALWAKAKSLIEKDEEALDAYGLAVTLNPNNPDLLLDYSVALLKAGRQEESDSRLEEAYNSLSNSTDIEVRKNIYKSLTYRCLYDPPPAGFERTLSLLKEYEPYASAMPSGGLYVNAACAWAQKFRYLAIKEGQVSADAVAPITLPGQDKWSADMKTAREETLRAAKRAMELDPKWTKNLKDLTTGTGDASEADLQIFENDPEFRSAFGLIESQQAAKTNSAGQISEDAIRAKEQDS